MLAGSATSAIGQWCFRSFTEINSLYPTVKTPNCATCVNKPQCRVCCVSDVNLIMDQQCFHIDADTLLRGSSKNYYYLKKYLVIGNQKLLFKYKSTTVYDLPSIQWVLPALFF